MLTGAHRVGKTTLAKAFSESSGIPFVQTGASHVFVEMGLCPKVDYPMEKRLEIQRRILESFERQCRSYSRGYFITDRTPIDFIAYTLADIQRENVPCELNGEVERYISDCFEVSNSLFPILTVVQPGIPLVEAEGKAPASMPYIEHINHLIMGLVVSEFIQSAHFYIPRNVIALEDRMACLESAIMQTEKRHRKEMEIAGSPLVLH